MNPKAINPINPKRFRYKKAVAFLLGIGLLFVLAIPIFVRHSTSDIIFRLLDNSANESGVRSKEFGIVLGAGIRKGGTPGSYLRRRLDDAVELYNNGKIRKVLLTGDNSVEHHNEIAVMNNYLVRKGVPQNVIFGDYAGFDTYSSMERAVEIFEIRDAIIVSQHYHLPRAVFIARYKGIDAVGYSSTTKYGVKRYFLREWFATIKSVVDCVRNREAKFGGEKIDTDGASNIVS